MNDHELYEVLCTLAATGQLAASEETDFDEHRLNCRACRDQFHDLVSIGVQLQLDEAIHATSVSMPAGSLERFRGRAIREGIAPCFTPARPSSWHALASAAAVFVIVAALVFMSHRRKAAESISVSTTARTPSHQGFSASVIMRTRMPRPSKAVHGRVVRHGIVPHHTDIVVNDASLTAQRFPQVIGANYPFFGPQSSTKSSQTGYPPLSQPQISRLNFFRNLDHTNGRNPAGIAATDRPIDIASTGIVFDFAANIRQLHFQLPTAQ